MAEFPPQVKWVGKGSNAAAISPRDPQWWLAGSVHPYAPFVGNALKWESYVYDDGTTYEGLMLTDIPHNKGILTFGNGLGGGVQRAERADRYEGEFDSGFVHGLGQYTHTKQGKLYRGEFAAGMKHGCGVEYTMKPFLRRVEKGMDPEEAWKEAQPEIDAKAVYGTWVRDTYLTGPDPSGRWCHIAEIRGTVEEVESVVAKARMFEFKPDGEVTARMAQDANGLPAPLMQDPLHYPHGTKFLAPGPLGQCHPVPDNEALKLKMAQAADTHRKIYEQYNLPYNIEPGSVMDKAQKLWKRKQARRQRALEKRLQREQQRIRRMERESEQGAAPAAAAAEAASAAAAKAQAPAPAKEEEEEEDDDEGGVDDDDLIAAAPAEEQPAGGSRPPTTFASMSIGLSRAALAVHRAFHNAAVRAPPRRTLTRPSHAAEAAARWQ